MFFTLNVSFVITFVIFCGFFHVLLWHVRRRRLLDLASKLKGPPIVKIVRNLCMLIGNNEEFLNVLNYSFEPYPSPCRLWVGPLLVCVITDAEQIKALCLSQKTLEKGQLFRDIGGLFLGSGLVTAPVSKWRAHRRIIQPTFNKKVLDSFAKIFAAQSKIFTEKIERHLDGPEFETFKLLSLCTLDMICESALGVKIAAQSKDNCRYGEAVQQVTDGFSHRLLSLWFIPDFIFYRTKSGKDLRENLKYLHGFAENVIKKKKHELLERNCVGQPDTVINKDNATDSSPVREAFLDHLMGFTSDTGKLPDEELREEVDTLMVAVGNSTNLTVQTTVVSTQTVELRRCQTAVANLTTNFLGVCSVAYFGGFTFNVPGCTLLFSINFKLDESATAPSIRIYNFNLGFSLNWGLSGNHGSAITLSFIMLMLASHPDIQDKVYEELHEIYGDVDSDERPVTANDLMHLKYLECVIKETLRLFPPVPFIVRQMTEEFDLGEHTLPEGSIALLGIYSIQRNEKYWSNPLEFNPDRFLPDAKEHVKRNPYAFMAFSGGPRNCIGMNYAMMSTKTVMATVLRRYILKKNNIVPVKDIRLTIDVLLKPVKPNSVRIERRVRK